MKISSRFPYKLEHLLYKTIQFERDPHTPDKIEVNFQADVKVIDKDFPEDLQIDIKFHTMPEDQFFNIKVEIIGLFKLVDDQDPPEKSILPSFINEQALHMLWPNIAQLIHQITSLMGVNPLNVPIPYAYDFAPVNSADPEEVILSEGGG